MVVGIDDDASMNLIRLFNEPAGHEYLTRNGVPSSIVEKLELLGISSVANLLGAIKFSKYYELTERDVVLTVLTDSMELYQTRLRELNEKQGAYNTTQAAVDHNRHLLGAGVDHCLELRYTDRKRIHNLKYYTWIEQLGHSVEELDAQWYDYPEYWDRIHAMVEPIDAKIDEFNERSGVLDGLTS
jgi:hypothetical protein